MKMKNVVLLCLPLLMFSCTAVNSVSDNQPKVTSDELYVGFNEQKISDNEYVVDYQGSSKKTSKVEDISMLKAAELADQNGYKNFVIEYDDEASLDMKSKKTKSNHCKVKLFNDVPGKYEVYYSAVYEKERLEKVYKLK